MAGLSTGAPIVKVYHEKSMILPDVSRVLACLYEKDIKFETHTASYKSLLRLQASNHAPVPFYDGPSFLEESREICRYIAETYEDHGYPFLLGKDSLERASIEQWLHHEEHAFNPPSRSLFCHLAFPLDEQDDDIDLQKRKLEEVLEVYEQRLSDSEFLAGNKFTLADLVHLPNSHYITESDKFVYLYDSRKNVQRWWNAISTRDSWQKVLKDIKKVDQQRKQEELEKQQQQQWQRGNPRTTRRQIRLDSRKHTSTKSQTILVPPPLGIISTSPAAPQAEKPRPAETSPAEAPVSSSLRAPTTPKSSAVQRKHVTISTTHRDTLQVPVQSTPTIPEKSPIPIQRTSTFFTPATSPTTSEKPPRIDADKSSIRDVSIPSEATKTDHPTKSKPSSTKKVSNNLHVFDFYKASSHTDEAEPYIEPTPQKTSEMLDKFSETDGSSDATLHAKTSPKSAKDGSDQLRASGFYKSDSTATSADSQHKESARYTERAPQRPAETIDGRSTVQRATDASPGKLRSTEVYQKLQAEQWHAATAGLSNLKREIDHLMPTQQVKPGKDVQQYSSQDSKQASTRPLAQEPVSMDGQQVQGPGMPTRAPYTDQKRDLSSMRWQQAADVRGIAEEDEASSDHNRGAVLPPYTRKHAGEAKIVSVDRRKDASLSKHVPDEAAQAKPFQAAYDDAHDTTQEARETASAPRRTRAQDARDTSEGIRTYHSASSRSQPIDAPQDAAPPSKKTAFEGPRHATTPYPGAQEFINQARESPASRPTVHHDAQDSTEEEETLESSSSRERLLDSRSDDAYPRKQSLDEDGYGAIAPLQTGYTDDQYNMKQDRDTAAPRRMMAQDAFEEKKIVDSASFKAQTFDYPRVDAPSRKQPPAEDPRTTTSPFQKRYSGNEDTTKQSKHAASRPRRMAAQEVQDNFEETMDSDSWSSREQPPDPWRAPGPLPRHEVDDAHSTTAPFKKRYPGTGGTTKEVEDVTSTPVAGEDAPETFEETKVADSASSRAQPLDYQRTDAPSRRQETIEYPLGATSPFEKRYADVEDTTKHSRDTAFKPRNMVGQDTQDASEEAEARNSALFRAQPPGAPGQKQPPDAWRAATTPSKQAAAEDALSVSQSSPTRYPRAEEINKQPRTSASIPMHIAAQDARDASRKSEVSDLTSFIEQPSDAGAAVPLPKQEVPDAHSVTAPFQKRQPDTEGTTKEAKGTVKEIKTPDSASSRVQPLDSQRADAPSRKKEAAEHPHRATSPFKKRHSDVEGTIKQSRDNAVKPRQIVGQDAQGTYKETKAGDFALRREQSSDTWQAATTPIEQVATQDGLSFTPPSEKRSPSDEDTIKRPRGTASAPRRTTAQDANDTFQDSKPADSVSSREQPLSAWQPVVTPPRQEIEDTHSTTSAFQKTYPYVDDRTRPAGDTAFAPRKIGSEDTKDITEETKVADSGSSNAKHTYTPRTALPLSEQAEAEEDARDKGRESKETTSAPKKMVSRDAQDSYGERKSTDSTSREQYLDNPQPSSPLMQAAAEDARGATRGAKESFAAETKHSQGVKDTTKKSGGILEETKGPGSIKAERTPSVYQEDPLVAQDSHEQAQTLPTGGRADGSTPKRQQAPVVSSTSEEKSTPSAPPRAKVRDDHSTEEPFKRDTVDDRKEALPLLGQEPTSQIQRATELLQAAAPDGDMSSKSSTIEQWWRASVPLQDVTPNSGNDLPNVSTIDQKPIPMSQQAIPSAPGANEMNKRSVEKRVEPPAPTGAQTSNVERAPPSFPGAVMVERAGEPVQMQAPTLDARPTSAATPTKRATPDARETGDQEFVNTSDGKTSKASKASHHSAIIHEDVSDASSSTHGATIDNKTTSHASEAQGSGTWPDSKPTPVNVRRPTSDDQLASRYLRDQRAQPPESTQEQTPLEAPRDPVPTQDIPSDVLARTIFAKPTSTEGMSPTAGPASTLEAQLPAPLRADPAPLQADAAYAEQKFAPSDKKTARAAQPLSSIESRKEDASVSATNQTKTPQTIFHQQSRPPAPITREVPSSDTQYDTRKIQEVSLDNIPTDDSAIPLVLSHEQVTHAPQTIPDKKDMTPAGDSPASDAQPASAKVQEVIPDNYHTDKLTMPFVSSEKQGSYAGSSTEPHERPSPDARSTVVDKDTTKSPSRQAPVLEARPDSTAINSYVRPTSGDEQGILPDQGVESPTVAQATYSEDLRNSAPTQDIRANALGDFKKLGPHSTEQEAISSTPGQASDLDAQPDSETGEVSPATKKFAPSDSVHSAQQPSPAEPRKEETIVAAAEQLPTTIGQQETQGMREVPTSDTQHASWKIQEVDPDIDLDKSVPSQEKVSQAGHTSESREGLTPLAHSSIVHDETTTAPASLTSISDAALDLTPTSNDVHPASGIEPGAEPPSSKQAPQHLEALDSVPAEDIPADASGEAQSMRPSVFPDDQRGRPGDAALAEQKFAPSDQDPAHSTQRPFSAEPRNEEIKDSARSAQPLHSTAADQTKDSQTTIGQQDISPAPGTSKSPSSGTDHASGKFQEVARDDHHIIESIPRQGQASRAKNVFEPFKGPAHDAHSAIDEKTMRPPSSQAQNSDSKPDSTQNRNDELSTGLLPNQVAQQHAETQASPPEMGLYDSKSTQDIPPEALGKAKSLKSSSVDQEATASKMASPLTPDTHLGNEPREVAPTGQKLLLKDQDSAQSAQKPSSSKATKEQFTFAAPDQAKASQTIFGQHASRKLLEIPPEDRRIDGSIPSQEQVPRVGHISEAHDGPTRDMHGAIVAEPMAHTTGPTSAPHAQHDQDSDRYSQPLASAAPRKEETNVVASDQTMAQKTTFSRHVITPAPGTSEASGEVLEVGPGDHRSSELTKPLIPSQKQISHAEYSEPHEGPNPDVNGAVVDENTAPPLVSQAHSLEAGPTSTPADGDVHPSSGDESVRGILCEQETQLPPPFQASIPPEALHDSLSTKNASAVASSKVEPLKATGDVTPADQNIAPSEPLSAVESRKEDSTGAEAEQSKVSEPIIGQQDIGNAPGISEFVRDDDRNKESVSSKEQVSHDQRASEPHEGSPPDVHGTFVDKTITIPPSQAQSSDAKRDSSPIRGDADPSSGDQSTTRFLPDHGTQQAATAKLPLPLGALHYSESTQDVPADALGKAKSVKPHSVDQEVMSPRVLPDTQLDTTPGEVAPDEQNYALPAQDLARPAQLPFSAEPAKEETIVAASDQASGAQTIIGQMMPATDKEKNPLSESYSQHASRKSQDDDQVDEPVPSQEQVSLGGHASEPQEGTSTDSHGANVDEKITTSPSPVTSSSHNPQAQTPARTQALPAEALGGPAFIQNVPADSLEKVKSPGPPSTDQEVMEPMIGPEPAPDAPQGTALGEATPAEQKFTPLGTYPVQPPHEASFDLSSDEKTTMIKDDQASTISNVSLSASQAVGQSESSAVKGALPEELVSSFSQKNLKGTSTEENSKQQQQTDQSNNRSSNDDSIEANLTVSPNKSGDIQPAPPKDGMEATEESRNQQQAEQAVFQSTQDNKKQVEETEAQDTGIDEREEMNLHQNTNQKNNGTSQGDALEQSGEHVPGVQPWSKETNNGSKSTEDAPSGIQTDNTSESSLRTSEESKQQVQSKSKTQGGESKAPASKTEQPKERDLPASHKSITSQSLTEASDKSEEQTSSNIQNRDKNSSKLDGSTNDTKSGDMEDYPSS